MYKIIGKCPLCGNEVKDYPKSFGCSNWKKRENGRGGCHLTIWKNYFGHEFSEVDAQRLLGGGVVGPYEFSTKDGHTFLAKAKLWDGEVKLLFDDIDDEYDESLIQ